MSQPASRPAGSAVARAARVNSGAALHEPMGT